VDLSVGGYGGNGDGTSSPGLGGWGATGYGGPGGSGPAPHSGKGGPFSASPAWEPVWMAAPPEDP
jgi:hypothetical protein